VNNLTKSKMPDRSKINLHQPREAKYWAHELGISKEQLFKLVEKVGNSASAVRKELAT
jgi:3-oxoacyl-[acyl-carrier-protein] synthase III